MQSWNDVLQYIKINLGQINKLEISDDDLIYNLKSQVLPFFSQYSGCKKFKALSDNNLIMSLTGQPMQQYRIPLEPEEYIINVVNVYFSKNMSLLDLSTPFINSPESAMDALIANSYIDMVRSMQAANTWEFLSPDILLFDFAVGFIILEYTTVHSDLKTIDPDKYQLIFKKLCLANVKIWISANRSKFENLTTPFGAITLNWEAMKAEGIQEKEECTQLLNIIPPEFLIHIDV
jgi:hypothetical protein